MTESAGSNVARCKKGLTRPELRTWLSILDHVELYGFQPRQEELARLLGVTRRTIYSRVRNLARKGFLQLPSGHIDRNLGLPLVGFEAVIRPHNDAAGTDEIHEQAQDVDRPTSSSKEDGSHASGIDGETATGSSVRVQQDARDQDEEGVVRLMFADDQP